MMKLLNRRRNPVLQLPEDNEALPNRDQSAIGDWSVTPEIKMGGGALGRVLQGILQPFQGPTLTISMENGVIRMVLLKGSRVIAWAKKSPSEYLPSEADDSGSPWESQAAAIKNMLQDVGARRARVVTDLPLYTALMRQVEVPDLDRRLLEPLVVAEVLETVPLFESEADISWRIHENGGTPKIFASVVPKQSVEYQTQLMGQAGVRPAATYSRPVALACAVNLANAVLVHVEDSSASIVLVHDGVPEFVHRVDLALEDTGPHEAADRLIQGIKQADGYHQTIEIEGDRTALPLVINGDLPHSSPILGIVRELLVRERITFAPEVSYPEDFPVDEYPANLGLAVADRYRSVDQGNLPAYRGISLNLVPQRYSPRTLRWKPVATSLVLLVLGLLAFGVLSPQVGAAEAEAEQLARRLTNTERTERLQRLAAGRMDKVEEELAQLQQQALGLDAYQIAAKEDVQALISRMNTISGDALPRGVRVSDLGRHPRGFAVSGTAFAYEDVIQYKENLLDSGRFSDVQIQQVQSQSDSEITFNLSAVVPSAPAEAGTENPEQ
ncbi:MAG: PilN domain-containing protein [Dehalococcoidia bacterium]